MGEWLRTSQTKRWVSFRFNDVLGNLDLASSLTEHYFWQAEDALALALAVGFCAGVGVVEYLGQVTCELEVLGLVVPDRNVCRPAERDSTQGQQAFTNGELAILDRYHRMRRRDCCTGAGPSLGRPRFDATVAPAEPVPRLDRRVGDLLVEQDVGGLENRVR